MRDYFNKCIDDRDELGDVLCGDFNTFSMTVKDLDIEDQKKFLAILKEEEIFDLA